MRRAMIPALAILTAVPLIGGTALAKPQPIPFGEAGLIIEINGTDGDAGLQLSVDGEAWRAVKVFAPDGSKIVDVRTKSDLAGYGLTELFSESNEPPFTEFPFDDFKALFPEGDYRIVGTTIEGDRLAGTATLTHNVPDAPTITFPAEDATVPTEGLEMQWEPVAEPPGIEIVGYQAIVVREDGLRSFEVDLPANATGIAIPAEFLEPNTEYKAEVLAIEASGNQTLTEVPFATD